MGIFSVTIQVGNLQGQRFESLEALVDTGSTYLSVPRPILESLRVIADERAPFALGDGRVVEYEVGEVSLRLDARTRRVLCVFAEADSEPLLGAVPLEIFGLAPDPVNQRLIPVRRRR